MLAVPRELGHCVGWRSCPDVRLGVALALPTRLPASAPERNAISPGPIGAAGSKPGVYAWCSVIRTYLSASLRLCLCLIPLLGIS